MEEGKETGASSHEPPAPWYRKWSPPSRNAARSGSSAPRCASAAASPNRAARSSTTTSANPSAASGSTTDPVFQLPRTAMCLAVALHHRAASGICCGEPRASETPPLGRCGTQPFFADAKNWDSDSPRGKPPAVAFRLSARNIRRSLSRSLSCSSAIPIVIPERGCDRGWGAEQSGSAWRSGQQWGFLRGLSESQKSRGGFNRSMQHCVLWCCCTETGL